MSSTPRLTLFLYTEEKAGNRLVESELIGTMSDISGLEQLVVVQDPHSGIKFVYRIDHFTNNLDAVAITELDRSMFDGRNTVKMNDLNLRLGPPANGVKLLRGKREWIQDKGSVLSVLLHNAARKTTGFVPRTIKRERLTQIPQGAPVEYLSAETSASPAPAQSAPAGEASELASGGR